MRRLHRGIVLIEGPIDEDELMMAALEAGAEDVAGAGDTWTVTCDPSDTFEVKEALEGAGYTVISADMPMVSDNWGNALREIAEPHDPDEVRERITGFVRATHESGSKIRFWAAPDDEATWTLLLDLGVDYLNADDLTRLQKFLLERK